MDYKKAYINLIKTRIDRKPDGDTYYEKHHIVPKCWGGTNKKENIIKLTAREHYIAHWLLYRMRPESIGTALAFWKMTFPGSKFLEKRDYKINSRMYAEAKSAMSNAQKKRMKGFKVADKHLEKWRRNKNNTKLVVNVKTGEEYPNAKEVWKIYFSTKITYSTFNYYMRGKIKNNGLPAKRKVEADELYEWKYKNNS
jgi:hypothetical protein